MTNPTPVAVIGLGSIGLGMANRLAAAPDVDLTVFNRSSSRYAGLAEGAIIADSLTSAVKGASVVILSLTDDIAVRSVVAEIASDIEPGAIVVDTSTIAAATAQELALALAHQEVGFVDSPVTGGAEAATQGTLTLLCGGEERHLDTVRPILSHCAGDIHHIGTVGQGQVAKAVNQIMLAGALLGVAEGVALAQRSGLAVAALIAALENGAAASWVLSQRAGYMDQRDYAPRGRIALHHKDLRIALQLAESVGLRLPLTRLVENTEAELLKAGKGDADVAVIIEGVS